VALVHVEKPGRVQRKGGVGQGLAQGLGHIRGQGHLASLPVRAEARHGPLAFKLQIAGGIKPQHLPRRAPVERKSRKISHSLRRDTASALRREDSIQERKDCSSRAT
jgi:hypothetical protein